MVERIRSNAGAAVAAVVMGIVGWSLYRQGMDLGGDGAWLLGSQRLLDGARLYRDLEPGDGPLRYWLLAPFLALRNDASALALMRSLALAAGTGLGVAWAGRRAPERVVWTWPALLLALGPIDPAAALLLTGTVLSFGGVRFGSSISAALVVLALALDPRVAVAQAILALGAYLGPPRGERERARSWLVGAALAAILLILTIPLSGDAPAFFRNSASHPWWRLGQHFADGGALRWWETLAHGARVHSPLTFLGTGEALQSFGPAHEFVHRWAWRGLAILSLAAGPVLAVSLRAHRRAAVACFSAAAAAVWIIAATGDVAALASASLVVFAGALFARATAGPKGAVHAILIAFSVLSLPLVGERLWMASRIDRPELEHYSRGGVDLARERGQRLDQFFERIRPALARPIVVWPDQAGLYFLYGAEPAVPQLGLRGLRLPEGTRSESLLRADPQVVLLAQNWRSTAQAFREMDAPLWSTLRERYRIAGWLRGRTDRLRLLVRMNESESRETMSLQRQLPLLELTVANDVSPALRRDLTVGQSFFTGDDDLSGVMFKWKTEGHDLRFDVKLRVWQRLGTEFDALLSSTRVAVEVPSDGARSYLRLELPESSHLELAVTLEVLDDLPAEVRLQWHRHDLGGLDVDLFEQGSALLDLHETDADLYFVAY